MIFSRRTDSSRLSRVLVATLAVAASMALLTASAEAKKNKKKKKASSVSLEELFNPLLGPDYSHWLVGPIYELATESEIAEFLDLVSDDEATAFVEGFWKTRNEGTGFFEDSPQEIFEQRAVEADKRYTEGMFPGRRTPRGTLLILYGEPEEIDFESPEKVGGPPLEVWKYSKEDAEEGLNGETPKENYRFIELDGKTVRYNNNAVRRWELDNRARNPRFPNG